jgi:AcrR family transcriptional regulator
MSTRRTPQISTRKQPQQARSTELVAAVLQAASQVLAKTGRPRFTMARVAAKAGVSVGSLYQYFPNKVAILFRLQSDEWRQTSEQLRAILEATDKAPLERLRVLVHAFIHSECVEADVREALSHAAPQYRDAPEAKAVRAHADDSMRRFMHEALPTAPEETCALAADLITTTLSAVGKQFSACPRTAQEIEAYADALADMFCAYVKQLHSASVPATTA